MVLFYIPEVIKVIERKTGTSFVFGAGLMTDWMVVRSPGRKFCKGLALCHRLTVCVFLCETLTAMKMHLSFLKMSFKMIRFL